MRSPGVLMVVLFLLAADAHAADWNQWRGPKRDGQSEGAPWPDRLDGMTQLWRTPLGPGYPGPIVTRDRVFVAETKDRKMEVVRAIDRAAGKQLWEHSWDGAMKVIFIATVNGDWIRATPAFDGKHVYVAGMRDVLVCIDTEKAKEMWRIDFAKEMKTPLPPFGFVSSPLVDENAVYIQAGGCVAKVEKSTGKILWTCLKEGASSYDSAFSSPIFATIQGHKQLLVQTRTKLAGVDLNKGEILWSMDVPAYKNMNILTPLVAGNQIFTSTYGGKSHLFEIQKSSKGWYVETRWTNKHEGYMSSPVIVNDHIYMHLKSQKFACLDLKTGKDKWVTGDRFGKYWSMAVRGDKMLALDERGILYLLRANPERFELLDERKVSDESTWGHIAVEGDDIVIRELNAVAAFRLSGSKK